MGARKITIGSIKRWRSVKNRVPIIGIDDGGFDRFSLENIKIPVFGVVMKGSAYVDGITQCQIDKDDPQVTTKIIQMILESSHHPQLQAIFLQGITIGGFGVLNITELHEKTGIPVIVVLRKYPDYHKIHNALKKTFPNDDERWLIIEQAGKPIKVQEDPLLFLQIAGIHLKDAFLLIKKCTVVGTIPEALRIAHFIGASNYRFLNRE
ncbi:MAG: DUF99 family protein [Candidatus Hermodarchaeota archaeon]